MPVGRHVVVVETARALVDASRADGRKRALPDSALVRYRAVGMSCQRDGIRERRERRDRFALVVAHGIRAVARSLRMRMLAVEEHPCAAKFRRVRAEVFADRRIEARPLRADEGVALHLTPPDRRPVLPEETPPHLLRIVLPVEALGVHLSFCEFSPPAAPGVDIVVAGGDHELHLLPVRPSAAGKHPVPHGGKPLKFLYQPGMRDVAGTQHRIDILGRKPSQRLLRRRLRIRLAADMHIAQDAETQARHRIIRRHVQRGRLRHAARRGHPTRSRRRKRRRTADKTLPCQFHYMRGGIYRTISLVPGGGTLQVRRTVFGAVSAVYVQVDPSCQVLFFQTPSISSSM